LLRRRPRTKKQLHRALFSDKVYASAVTKNPDYSGLDKMNRQQTCRAPGPDPSELVESSFLPSSGLGALALTPGQNAYKTRTKCIQKRGCEFFNHSATATYNFNMLKCMHFPSRRRSLLPRGEGQDEGQTGSSPFGPHSCEFVSIRGSAQSKIANQKSKIGIDCTYTERKLNKTE
jgi:hypothetical protein